MKTLFFAVLLGALNSSYAQDVLLAQGKFESLTPSAQVSGEALVYRTGDGEDYLELRSFRARGGIVHDLKICGTNDIPSRYCLSLGTLTRRSPSRWAIPKGFVSYEQVLLFDVELIQNLGLATLHVPDPMVR